MDCVYISFWLFISSYSMYFFTSFAYYFLSSTWNLEDVIFLLIISRYVPFLFVMFFLLNEIQLFKFIFVSFTSALWLISNVFCTIFFPVIGLCFYIFFFNIYYYNLLLIILLFSLSSLNISFFLFIMFFFADCNTTFINLFMYRTCLCLYVYFYINLHQFLCFYIDIYLVLF